MDRLAELPRMGRKSALNLVAEIDASRQRTLDGILCGVGITQTGQVAARQLAEAVGSWWALLSWSDDTVRERIGQIFGFGPSIMEEIV